MRGTAKGHRLFLENRRKKKQWEAFYDLFAPASNVDEFEDYLKDQFKAMRDNIFETRRHLVEEMKKSRIS